VSQEEYDELCRDEWLNTPCGSCDNCGTNIYPDDDDGLCNQCAWFDAMNIPEQRASE
jgi:hypothetical protein